MKIRPIVKGLKRMPKPRPGIYEDDPEILAMSDEEIVAAAKATCGVWADREDIDDQGRIIELEDLQALESGWSFDLGVQYHFEHILYFKAKRLEVKAERFYIVETINGTIVSGSDPIQVHYNRYLASDLASAIGLAARITIDSIQVSEMVVKIRPARTKELDRYFKVADYFAENSPRAISDQDCAKIQD